jgi:putative transposase
LKISTICRVLEVSRSGYYDWLARQSRPPSPRAAQAMVLVAAIREIHAKFRYYGSPRVHAELLARNHQVGRHRAARLMRQHGISAQRGKVKYKPRAAPPARRPDLVDLVDRDFHADVPNAVWFTDITQIRTGQGWLYAAVILDAYNREVISWATAATDNPRTAMKAFTDAIAIRRPPPGCLIHSDRGYQFTSHDWSATATKHHLRISIGARKSCYDNAAMESWFASFKTEEIYPKGQPFTRPEAARRLFEYIWSYNTERKHSTLGYVSPRDYANASSTCP